MHVYSNLSSNKTYYNWVTDNHFRLNPLGALENVRNVCALCFAVSSGIRPCATDIGFHARIEYERCDRCNDATRELCVDSFLPIDVCVARRHTTMITKLMVLSQAMLPELARHLVAWLYELVQHDQCCTMVLMPDGTHNSIPLVCYVDDSDSE